MGKKIGAVLIGIVAIGLIGFTSVKLFSQDGYFSSKNKTTYSDDEKVNGNERYHSTVDLDNGTYEGQVILVDGIEIADGQGKVTYASGDVYEGGFKDDMYDGQGKYICKNGDVYEGEYKDDKKDGQGKYVYEDGTVEQGEYKEGKLNGRGKITYADGKILEGIFKNDVLVRE